MDPVSFLFLITSLIGSGITIADSIVQDAEEARANNQYINTGKVKSVLDTTLAQVSDKANGVLDNVLNQISRMDFIQSSPTLRSVIERAKDRLKRKEQSLRSDISELQGIAIQNQYQYDKANTNISKSNVEEKLKTYQKEANNNNEKIKEIESRI